ncbi:MAG: hypothetical protein VX354_04165, partial [Pseudomonadota bacterium]
MKKLLLIFLLSFVNNLYADGVLHVDDWHLLYRTELSSSFGTLVDQELDLQLYLSRTAWGEPVLDKRQLILGKGPFDG